jgi:hypothetical protein
MASLKAATMFLILYIVGCINIRAFCPMLIQIARHEDTDLLWYMLIWLLVAAYVGFAMMMVVGIIIAIKY